MNQNFLMGGVVFGYSRTPLAHMPTTNRVTNTTTPSPSLPFVVVSQVGGDIVDHASERRGGSWSTAVAHSHDVCDGSVGEHVLAPLPRNNLR
jgi:hypothetical protein